ncbi:putative rubber elongation factor [Helianthus anomalus]
MWYKVNTYPLGNALAGFTLPVVEYLSKLYLYNKVVTYMDGKCYRLFGYLPSLPIEEMKVAYKLVKTTMDGSVRMNDNDNT